jgi:hypothetical protein
MGLKRATGFAAEPDSPNTPPGPANGASLGHIRTKSISGASIHSTLPGGATVGTATFTVVSASGYPEGADIYVVINQTAPKHKQVVKTKHHKPSEGLVKFDETTTFRCTPDAQFQIKAYENHHLRSDGDLGEALYFVDESGSAGGKEVKVGNGTVVLKSNFVPAATESLGIDGSSKSGLRRSFLGKRESRSREGTPT